MPEVVSVKAMKGDEVEIVIETDRTSKTVVLHADTCLKHALRPMKTLSAETWSRILEDDAFHRLTDTALRMLARRPTSASVLRTKLRRTHASEALVERVVEQLAQTPHLDEAALVETLTEHFLNTQDKGPAALKAILLRKGFPASLIDKALESFSRSLEVQKCERAANAALGSLKTTSLAAKKRTLASRLKQRGFSSNVIRQTIDSLHLSGNDATALAASFQRACRRYDPECPNERRKLIARLIREGYAYDDVVRYLEEKA